MSTTTYSINVTDSESPPAWLDLCASAAPGNQDGGRCRWSVATVRASELEAALDADPSVLEYAAEARDGVSGALARQVLTSLSQIADVRDSSTGYRVVGHAPDSSSPEYGGDTGLGSPWHEECDRLLLEIQSALPPGWEASWSDDDVRIDGPEVES